MNANRPHPIPGLFGGESGMRGCLRHIQQTDEAIEALCDAGDRLMRENDELRAELAAACEEIARLRADPPLSSW